MKENRSTTQIRVPEELKDRIDIVAAALAKRPIAGVRLCKTSAATWVPASEVVRLAIEKAFKSIDVE